MDAKDAIAIPGVAEHALEIARIEFYETGDPLLPWHACGLPSAKVEVPQWVLEYFSHHAQHLNSIVKEGKPSEAKETGKALGFAADSKAAQVPVRAHETSCGIGT